MEPRIAPTLNTQSFGPLVFNYTVVNTNQFYSDGTLESSTLPVTLAIGKVPVLSLPGGVTITRGAGGILAGSPPPSVSGLPISQLYLTGSNGLVSFTSGNAAFPVVELLDGNKTQLLTAAPHTFNALSLLSSTGTPFTRTEVIAITNPGTQVVTPAKMEPYIVPNGYLVINKGQPDQETVQVTSVVPNTSFTATFAYAHQGGFTIDDGGTISTGTLPTTNSTLPIQSAAGVVVVTPAEMEPYIVANVSLLIDAGKSDQETVKVTSATATTFTATFANTHPGGFTIAYGGSGGTGSAITTTSASAIPLAATGVTVTPAVMKSYTVPNASLLINAGQPDQETVHVTSVTSTTFTADFAMAHSGGFTIDDGATTNANLSVAATATVETVTPAVMESYIKAGASLVINHDQPDQETVNVIAVTGTTFTATFVNAHPGGFTIDALSLAQGNNVVTPAVMEPYITPGASLVINQGQPDQETVLVVTATANTFTATFPQSTVVGAFTIINGGSAEETTAAQTISGTDSYGFQNIALTGPLTSPIISLYSNGNGFTADTGRPAAQLSTNAGPLGSELPATAIPYAQEKYEQISIAGPLVLGPGNQDWSYNPDNETFTLGSTAITTTSLLATYNANLNQMTLSGAGVVFLNANKVTTLAEATTGPLSSNQTTIKVNSWNIASQYLPYVIRVDSEEMIVKGEQKNDDGTYTLTIARGAYGTKEATHISSTPVIGGIDILLGNNIGPTAENAPGIIVTNNILTKFEMTVLDDRPFTITSGLSITPVALQFTYSQTSDMAGTHDVFSASGIVNVAYVAGSQSGTLSLALGTFGSLSTTAIPGFVIKDGNLVSVAGSVTSLGGQGIKIGSVTLVNPSGSFAYATGTTGTVTSVTIGDGGDGYSSASPPTVTFVGGGGTGAAGTGIVNAFGAVTGVTMTSIGSGYTSAPTVVIAPPPSSTSGATRTALGSAIVGSSFAISLASQLELPKSTLGKLSSAVSVSSSDPIIVTVPAGTVLPTVPYPILVGNGPYEEMIVANETLTGTIATLTVLRGANNAPLQDLPINATVALCVTVSGSVAFQNGAFKSFTLNAGGSTTFTYHNLSITAQNLGISYTAPDTISLSGAAGLVFMAGGQQQVFDVTLGNLAAVPPVPGLVIQDGVLQSLNASVNAAFNFKSLHITVNQLTVAYNKTTDSFMLDGGIGVSITGTPKASGTPSAFGILAKDAPAVGSSPFQTIYVTLKPGVSVPSSFPFLITIGSEQIEVTSIIPVDSTMYAMSVSRSFNGVTGTPHAGANVSVFTPSYTTSPNSLNLSATFGDIASGGPNHGIVIENGELQSLYIVANGGFTYGLSLQATGVTIVYANNELELSGGVSVALSSKFAFAASIASSTPLQIDTQTGAFSIPHGLDISGSLKIGTFLAAAVTVDYTSESTFSVTGQVTVANQFTVNGAFTIFQGKLKSIALSYSNNTGIPIGQTGLYLTEFGAEVDNITDPPNIQVSGSIAITGMGGKQIAGHSFITASGTFFVDRDELKITGNVSLVGGLLGQGSAALDINWTSGVYSLSAQLSLFDGIVSFNGLLYFDSTGKVTISASADIKVPDGVPLIGGDTIVSMNFYLQIRPDLPKSKSFVAAWTTFLGQGVGFEYNFDDDLSFISGPPPEDLAAAATPPQTIVVNNGAGTGAGTLPDAIQRANNDVNSSTTIYFQSNISTVTLSAPLNITTNQSVTIIGLGSSQLTINGENNQVFNIASVGNVYISGATITGGKASNGGGISNSGTLLLNDIILNGNTASSDGGGIYNTGTLALSGGGTIINNNAKTGGGIWNSGSLTVDSYLVYQNHGSLLTGGIFSTSQGSLKLTSTTVADNNYLSSDPTPLSVSAPDIDGKVDSSSSKNIIGDGDSMTGINDGDANGNQVGNYKHPLNPFVYTVNVNTDSNSDFNSGMMGDLRYCVAQANGQVALGLGISPTIQFNSNLGTITLTRGLLELTHGTGTVTIDGGGDTTISGGGNSTIFSIDSGATVVLTGLTISNGHGSYPNFRSGGGIYSYGTLTLTNSTVSGNHATYGGGIFNAGHMSLSNCTISNNSVSGQGGGIDNLGTMTATGSTISNNSATGVGSLGGGIDNESGSTLTVSSSTVSGNSAASNAGGILNSGTMTLSSSTVSGNSAVGAGGGNGSPGAGGIENGGSLNLSNSTINGNSGGSSGGIVNLGTLTASHDTISGNSAQSTNLSANATSAGGIHNYGTLSLSSSIVAKNTTGVFITLSGNTNNGGQSVTGLSSTNSLAVNMVVTGTGIPANTVIYKIVSSSEILLTTLAIATGNNALTFSHSSASKDIAGSANGSNNLIGIGTGMSGNISNGTSGNLVGSSSPIDPLLGALTSNNGGPTQTMALLPGSPALGAGSSSTGQTDQRGVPRPTGASDIGAFQSVAFTVNVTTDTGAIGVGTGSGDVGDLRYCVAQVNALVALDLGLTPTISFAASLNGHTITLRNAPVELKAGDEIVTLDGAGQVTISGGGAISIFQIDAGAQADFTGLTFANAKGAHGGAINNAGTLTLTNDTFTGSSATFGAGIYNSGTLSASSLTISNSSATSQGGGIYNSGTLTLTSSTISGSSAGAGGGIYNSNHGMMTLSISTLSGNSAEDGGGVENFGTMTISSCTLSSNTASNGGAGINDGGLLTVTDTTIAGNHANGGGGIYSFNGQLTVISSTISRNSASHGGGIFDSAGNMTLENTIVALNTAVLSGPDILRNADGSYNLIGDGSGMTGNIGNGSNGNLVGTATTPINPILAPLADNGGPTQTMALLHGSPAIGAASPVAASHVRYAASAGAATIVVDPTNAISAGQSFQIDSQDLQASNVAQGLYASLSLQRSLTGSISQGDTVQIFTNGANGSTYYPLTTVGYGASAGATTILVLATPAFQAWYSQFGGAGTLTIGSNSSAFQSSGAFTLLSITLSSPLSTGISSGDSVYLPDGTDQRGAPLPPPPHAVDIGAFQTQVFTVTSAADSLAGVGSGFSGDLRYAVAQANKETANGVSATIAFATSLNGQTITLQNGPLELMVGGGATTVYGEGQGITVSGFNFVNLLGTMTSGSNIIRGLSSTSSLSRGMLVAGANIPPDDTILAIGPSADEIQLSQPASLTAANVPLSIGSSGSVFQIDSGATATLVGLTISNGNAAQGGGINNAGVLTLMDTTISGNFANSGGGIFNAGALTLTSSSVNGNTSISGDQIGGDGTIAGTNNVGPATPIISSLEPVNVTFGTALDNSQLNGTARWTVGGLSVFVDGTFAYTSAAGAILGTGNGQVEDVTFTPSDSVDYTTATTTVIVNVTGPILTITANDNSKAYGETASDTGTINGLQADDGITVTFSSAGDAATAGVGSYTITATLHDPNGKLGNYTIQETDATLTVGKADANIDVRGYLVTYDGNSHLATGSATGAFGESLSGLDLSATVHTNTTNGAVSDAWIFTDVTGNYNNASGSISDQIDKANAAISPTGYHVTYDGNSHMATGSATGVKGESLAGLNLSGTTRTNATAGAVSDSWTFTDVTGNYNNASGSVSDQIDKADAGISVNGYHVTYDANSHSATGSATGVKGESLAGLDLSAATRTNATTGAVSDSWTFTDVTGNYNNASGSVSDQIDKANATISINGYHVTFDGNGHSATGSATGVKGESLAGLDLSAATRTNSTAGAISDAWTFTDVTGNYNNASGSVSDQIDKANATVVVKPYSVTYDANPHTADYSVKGVGTDLAAAGASLQLNATHTNAGTYSDSWSLSGGNNYNDIRSIAITDIIGEASVTYTIGNVAQTYGSPADLTQALGGTIATGIGAETLSISYASAGDSATAHVGSYPITGALADDTGALANYAVTLHSGTLTVIPFAFTYQIGSDTQVAGTPANLAADLGTSIATGDNGQALSISYASTGNTATAPPGAYPISATLANGSGLTSDYNVTLQSGVLTVTGAVNEILMLDPTAPGSLKMSGNSVIDESSWPVYVNSKSATAIQLSGNASLTASKILDVGGYQRTGNSAFHPAPVTGSAATSDPLVNMQPPSAGSTRGAVNLGGNSIQTIQPGTYTQIAVSGNANLTLVPGVYVVTSGGFSASGHATIKGRGVVVYIAAGSINLSGNSTALLTAPTSGAYIGVSIFQARSDSSAINLSGNVYLSSGTLYAPNAALNLSGNSNLSAPLIVDQLALSDNADPSPAPPSRLSVGQASLPLDLVVFIHGSAEGSLPGNFANVSNETRENLPKPVQGALDQIMASLSLGAPSTFGEELLDLATRVHDSNPIFAAIDDALCDLDVSGLSS
jgi:fibronectin-binding autotransporter adhesin